MKDLNPLCNQCEGINYALAVDANLKGCVRAGIPRGQREQTVNLSPNGFEGSNPSPATAIRTASFREPHEGMCGT